MYTSSDSRNYSKNQPRLSMSHGCPTCGCPQCPISDVAKRLKFVERELAALKHQLQQNPSKMTASPQSGMSGNHKPLRRTLSYNELRRQLINREQHITYLEDVIRELHDSFKKNLLININATSCEGTEAEAEVKVEMPACLNSKMPDEIAECSLDLRW